MKGVISEPHANRTVELAGDAAIPDFLAGVALFAVALPLGLLGTAAIGALLVWFFNAVVTPPHNNGEKE